VPADTEIRLTVTSGDVFHNFGIPGLRVKSDAIPGQTTETWFVAEEPGRYQAACYELCGQGHSYMTSEVVVMSEEEYEKWYGQTTPAPETPTPTETPHEEEGGH
jgi:cytochrome c oxidase subunit 2